MSGRVCEFCQAAEVVENYKHCHVYFCDQCWTTLKKFSQTIQCPVCLEILNLNQKCADFSDLSYCTSFPITRGQWLLLNTYSEDNSKFSQNGFFPSIATFYRTKFPERDWWTERVRSQHIRYYIDDYLRSFLEYTCKTPLDFAIVWNDVDRVRRILKDESTSLYRPLKPGYRPDGCFDIVSGTSKNPLIMKELLHARCPIYNLEWLLPYLPYDLILRLFDNYDVRGSDSLGDLFLNPLFADPELSLETKQNLVTSALNAGLTLGRSIEEYTKNSSFQLQLGADMLDWIKDQNLTIQKEKAHPVPFVGKSSQTVQTEILSIK